MTRMLCKELGVLGLSPRHWMCWTRREMRQQLDELYSPAMVDQIIEAATRFDQGEVPVGSFLSSSSFDPQAHE